MNTTAAPDVFENAPLSGAERFGLEYALSSTPPANFPKLEEEEMTEDINHFVFYKKFTCKCCNNEFQNWFPKEKRARLSKLDSDLRPIYTPVDPAFYDIVICPQCGYGAPSATFEGILPFQKDIIKQVVYPQFKYSEFEPRYSVIDAIQRYKYALYVSTLKSPNKNGERAFIALKLSWFYKEIEDMENNRIFAELAYNGFIRAIAEETPPIMGMNYDTLSYIMSALAITIGKPEAALLTISKVMTSKTASKQLRDMAFNLKEDIAETRKKEKATQAQA